MTNPSYFRELMLRAPAVPEWFCPDYPPMPREALLNHLRGYVTAWHSSTSPQDFDALRVLQWPSYYAREVVKAAGGEAKGQRMPNALAGYLCWNEHWIKPGYLNLASYKVWNGEAWVNPDDFKGETHTSYEDRP